MPCMLRFIHIQKMQMQALLCGAHSEVGEVRYKYNTDIRIIENQKEKNLLGGMGKSFMEEMVFLSIF